MKVPVRWVRELVDTDLSTREIAQRMTLAGLEAESITQIGAEWERVFGLPLPIAILAVTLAVPLFWVVTWKVGNAIR